MLVVRVSRVTEKDVLELLQVLLKAREEHNVQYCKVEVLHARGRMNCVGRNLCGYRTREEDFLFYVGNSLPIAVFCLESKLSVHGCSEYTVRYLSGESVANWSMPLQVFTRKEHCVNQFYFKFVPPR